MIIAPTERRSLAVFIIPVNCNCPHYSLCEIRPIFLKDCHFYGKIATKVEELEMIAQRNPEMKKAIVKIRELSADEKARDMIERRQKGILDFNMFVNDAKMEGRAEGRAEERNEIALRLLKLNLPLEQIAMITGLYREEVDELRG